MREAVEDAVSTIEYDESSAMCQSSIEQAQAIREVHPWAAAHSTKSLTKALMAFKLNAFSFGDHRSALFPTIRLMQHACDPNSVFAPRPIDATAGRGVVIATRSIAEGEPISISYHDTVAGRRMRRKILLHKKQFVCRCTRCRAPDWNSQVPCPGCHPRTPDGRLPTDDPALFSLAAHRGGASRVHYARREAEGPNEEVEAASTVTGDQEAGGQVAGGGVAGRRPSAWRCTHCLRTWTASDVFPSGSAMQEEEIEQEIEHLVSYLELRLGCSHEGHADPALLADADASIFEAALATTGPLLGMRHWATIKLLCLRRAAMRAEVRGQQSSV